MVSSTSAASLDFLKLVAHELRWQLVALLARSDYRVQELVERVERPMNLVSYHLKQLRRYQLVSEHRSSADGRDVYYSLDLARLSELYRASGAELHPGLIPLPSPADLSTPVTVSTPIRVLFLCTHNSARSQMAEGLLQHLGRGWVEVFSAGSEPATIQSNAIRALAAVGIDISRQQSKHLNDFQDQSFDYIITVCDKVRENCPVFPGEYDQIHWSLPDPVAVEGSAEERYQAFVEIARDLTTRLNYLLLLIQRNPVIE